MKYFLLIISFLITSLIAFAQEKPKYYFELNNGEVKYTNILFVQTLKTGENPFLLANGKDSIYLKDVKGYRVTDGYFRKFQSGKSEKFYKAEVWGKLNLYSSKPNKYGLNSINSGSLETVEQSLDYFMALPDNKIGRINYKRLLPFLEKDAAAMEHLKKGRKLARWRNGATIFAATVFTAGAFGSVFLTANSSDRGAIALSPALPIGVGAFILPLVIKNPKKHYLQAVKTYNSSN